MELIGPFPVLAVAEFLGKCTLPCCKLLLPLALNLFLDLPDPNLIHLPEVVQFVSHLSQILTLPKLGE